MDAETLKTYRDIVRHLIQEYATHKPSHGHIDTEAILDDQRGHYEVMQVGWQDDRRVHGSVIHIDILNGKVWIQYDGTSPGIAHDLIEAGIPRDNIVLGFHPEYVRQHTGFAVN